MRKSFLYVGMILSCLIPAGLFFVLEGLGKKVLGSRYGANHFFSLLGLIFMMMGLMFLLMLLVYSYYDSKCSRLCTVPVTATVTEVNMGVSVKEHGPDQKFWRPTFSYRTPDGKDLTVRAGLDDAADVEGVWKVGERVTLLINPEKPKEYRIELTKPMGFLDYLRTYIPGSFAWGLLGFILVTFLIYLSAFL